MRVIGLLGVAAAFALLPCSTALADPANQVDLKAIWDSLTPDERESLLKQQQTGQRDQAKAVRTPGDTCAAATLEVSALPFNDANTTVGQTDDLTYGAACGGFNGSSGVGPDIAYRVRTDVDCGVTVTMDPTANDLAVWVVTDCADPVGACVGGDDSGGNGTAEAVSFSATAGTDYFVVVDGFGGAADTFTLNISETTANGCQLVPVELQGFQVD